MIISPRGILVAIDKLWHDSNHPFLGFLPVPLLLPPNVPHLSAPTQLRSQPKLVGLHELHQNVQHCNFSNLPRKQEANVFLVPSMQPWKKLIRINGINRPANVIHTGMWNLYSTPSSKEAWIVASGTPEKSNRGISNFGGSHAWRTIVRNWGFWEDDGL